MGYRRMNIIDLKCIYRRLRSDQSIKTISESEGYDRKTIRHYRDAMKSSGLLKSPDPSEEILAEKLFELLPNNERSSPIHDEFHQHKDEIIRLTTREQEPMKLKSAFIVIKQKYGLGGSYESFKVFSRKHHLTVPGKKQFPRLELPPGEETQIDYGRVGLHEEPETGKNRVVNAFAAKLSSSRLPFIEFTYSQNQESFVGSNDNMVRFFSGVTEYLTIDNLKSGVIRADIYDPQINKAYAEWAEHHGTFINPCIKAHAKGKAKVERMIPDARELFRRLKELHPSATLKELNEEAKKWCLNEYGQKKHGTTGIPPYEAFIDEEKPKLKPINPIRFEIPVWKSANVHMDQFVSFEKKRFSMPLSYRRKIVHCRRAGSLVKIYDENYLFIRQYVTTSRKVYCTDGDFPPDQRAMMKGDYPQFLIGRAAAYGSGSKQLVEQILRSHAFINARIAKGMITLFEQYKDLPLLQDVCSKAAAFKVRQPKHLKIMLEDEKKQKHLVFEVPRSTAGEAMVRDIREYISN